jgi:hypothetical protein
MAAWATPVLACDDSPYLPILPGETKAAFNERFDRTWMDLRVVQRFQQQRRMLANAGSVYLGKVIDQRDLQSNHLLHVVRVEPVYIIKGKPRKTVRTLTDTSLTSCGPKGDGGATYARLGDWVFVFEGLPRSDWRPRGYDSILARDAVTDELIAALWKVGADPDS